MRIREIIREKGLTTETLASKIGISVSSLNQSISGNPRVDTLARIADALGVSIAELFEERSEPKFFCPHCGKEIKVTIR